ncbi:MAG: aspartate-semialdehyde dehydrogenase [Actinomycetota bacterium]
MRVAVVGATGAVGRQMLRILEERRFPVDEVVPLASARSTGSRVRFRDDELTVRELTPEALRGVDLALSSCGSGVAKGWVPGAAAAGTTCIDNSSAFRMDDDAALVIPEVNPEALASGPRVISVPNCTTITALMAVVPLHRVAGLRSLVTSSYQSVSGAGNKGIEELRGQMDALRGREDELLHPDVATLPVGPVVGRTIAYNVVPRIDVLDPATGSSFEETKMVRETRKILGLPDLEVIATCVRVPVLVGHAVSVLATFDRPISPDDARAAIAAAPGVELVDDAAGDRFPTPLDAAGRDEVLVGRVRAAGGRADAIALFACGDNLRKGAALNAVQIAERVVAS